MSVTNFLFSKLLETLDRAVLTDEISVGDAVLDKAYMVQLVEVQHKRGAKGGETFARVLGLQENIRAPDVEIIIPELMDGMYSMSLLVHYNKFIFVCIISSLY